MSGGPKLISPSSYLLDMNAGVLLFVSRSVRMFAFGSTGVVLVSHSHLPRLVRDRLIPQQHQQHHIITASHIIIVTT